MSSAKDMEKLIQRLADERVPGCGVQIVQNGKVLYEGYAGYSDLESKKPITADSVYRQASMSKLPLYTVMMMLFEQGKYLMEEPISRFLPEYEHSVVAVKQPNGYAVKRPAARPINFRDVLSMKCGLPYCNVPTESCDITLQSMTEAMRPLWEKGYYSLREHVRAMAQVPLEFDPGTHWLYGFSSELAAALVEEICQKPVTDVFREMLFEPLGMDSTWAQVPEERQGDLVTLYSKSEKGYGAANFFGEKKGGKQSGWPRLSSTVGDYTKLMQMLACGGVHKGKQILGRKTIDLMRANGLTGEMLVDFNDTYERGYGYGYGVRTLISNGEGDSNGSLGAFGWTGGFGTYCEADPTEKLSIVYMHNLLPDDEIYCHLRVRNVAYGLVE